MKRKKQRPRRKLRMLRYNMNTLYFDKPAAKWEEAIPLGNGFLGAMVHGKIEKELLEMNEDSLWTGPKMERRSPIAGNHIQEIRDLLENGNVEEAQKLSVRSLFSTTPHSRHYQPLGQVWIEFHKQHKEISRYQRTLDLETALFQMTYSDETGTTYTRESFISYPENTMLYKLSASEPGQLNFDVYLQRRDVRSGKTVSYLESITCEENVIFLSGYNGNQNDGISYTMACSVQVKDGTITQYGTRLAIENATEVYVYVTGRTSYRTQDCKQWCKNRLLETMELSYDNCKEAHIKDYQELFHAMRFTIPDHENVANLSIEKRLKRLRNKEMDPNLVSLYVNFGRYLLIASSREGSLPANLQGIWANEFEPSWGSKYTININLQMNYWLAEKAGLSKLHMPLMEFLKKMYPSAQETAREIYHARGACAHHNTDIWGDCDPMDFNPASTIWPMGYVWLSLHILEHFKYTRDEKFIQEYIAILNANVLFLQDYLYMDTQGYLASGPSISPENTYQTTDGQRATICKSPAMDIQMIREFLNQYVDVCNIVKQKNYREEAMEILAQLPPTKIGKHKQIMEWQEDYDEVELGHRHISHLFALYPGTQIQVEKTPELIDAAKVTLQRRLSHGGGHTGWSCAWMIHFFARLHESKQAYDMLMKLFTESTLDNLFDNCPPFEIDGNFGGANAILEMLVQDYESDVYLLPALPNELPEGNIENLVLKCGAKLSFTWKHGKLKTGTLIAQRALRISMHINNIIYDIQLAQGESYVLDATAR